MKFERVDRYYEQSDCGGYTVCAVKVAGAWAFEAWRIEGSRIGSYPDADQARQACRDDKKDRARA